MQVLRISANIATDDLAAANAIHRDVLDPDGLTHGATRTMSIQSSADAKGGSSTSKGVRRFAERDGKRVNVLAHVPRDA